MGECTAFILQPHLFYTETMYCLVSSFPINVSPNPAPNHTTPDTHRFGAPTLSLFMVPDINTNHLSSEPISWIELHLALHIGVEHKVGVSSLS